MKTKDSYLITLLCSLAAILLEPTAVKAAGVDFTIAINRHTLETPGIGTQASPQPAVSQILRETPSISTPEVAEVPPLPSPSVSRPEAAGRLVLPSPSDPSLPPTVAEAAEATSERIAREQQNREKYAERVANAEAQKTASSANQVPASPQPDRTPIVIQSPAIAVAPTEIPTEAATEVAVPPPAESVPRRENAAVSLLAQAVELEELTFQCGESNGLPATLAKVKDSDQVLVILWSSDFFKSAGYDAQVRCNQVSARFAAYSRENPKVYLTAGERNGQSIICLTNNQDGSCGEGISLFDGLLFTLKPTDNSQQILKDLAAIFHNKTGAGKTPVEQ